MPIFLSARRTAVPRRQREAAPVAHDLSLCIAAINFYPAYAGPAIRFQRYLPLLLADGISAHVFSGTPELSVMPASAERDWIHLRRGEVLPVTKVERVAHHRVRIADQGPRLRDVQFGRGLARHCRQLEKRPDVVQLLACRPSLVPALLRLRGLGIPTVYTATLLPDPKRRSPLRRQLLQRYISTPMRLVDAVVVSSEVMRVKFQQLGVRTPIHVIPNGVDVERFRPPANPQDPLRREIRASLGIGPDDLMAFFLGPIELRKGVDLALEAFAQLAHRWPRLHLVLGGPRLDLTKPENESFRHQVSELITASGAPERVRFPGLIRNPEAYLRAADVFVFPSRREGMPNVVPEAMASGLPVVLTPFEGLPAEFGQTDTHYLLADFEAASIASAIERILESPRLRHEFATNARRWTERELPVERSVASYADLYRRLAAESRFSGATS